MTRPTLDEWGLRLALVVASRGTCGLRRVGCVLLDGVGHVLSTGYNGAPAGEPHCAHPPAPRCRGCGAERRWYKDGYFLRCVVCGDDASRDTDTTPSDPGNCVALHAEWNALLQCPDPRRILTAYVTAQPCVTCVKLLLNTSCRRVVFIEEYPHSDARELWTKSGRAWIRLSSEHFNQSWPSLA